MTGEPEDKDSTSVGCGLWAVAAPSSITVRPPYLLADFLCSISLFVLFRFVDGAKTIPVTLAAGAED